MHAFLSSLTAALLFIHAAFGCCWHHAHRCAEHSVGLAADHEHPCPHGRHGDRAPEQKPCGCTLECGDTCAYLAPQKLRLDGQQSVASLDLVAVTSPDLCQIQQASHAALTSALTLP